MIGPEFARVYSIVKRTEYEEFLQVISPWEREHLLSTSEPRPRAAAPSARHARGGIRAPCPAGKMTPMNLLYANDRPGRTRTAGTPPPPRRWRPSRPLRGDTRADVCVVGAGYTGLSAALHLAEAASDVVLLDAHRVGFGASGRNGGQLGSGQRQDQARSSAGGRATTRALWASGRGGQGAGQGADRPARHRLSPQTGDRASGFSATRTAAEARLCRSPAPTATAMTGTSRSWTPTHFAPVPSPRYRGGTLDMGAAHLHPLAMRSGWPARREAAGVRIHEATEVPDIDDGDRPVSAPTRAGCGRSRDPGLQRLSGRADDRKVGRGSCRSTTSSPRPNRWATGRRAS